MTTETLTKADIHKGIEVRFNGDFRGWITEICDGALDGMVVVDTGRGSTCIDISNVRRPE